MANIDLGKTSMGLKANIAAALSYALGIISGIIFYLVEKENKFVRFHAMQSIVVFGFFTVLFIFFSVIPSIGGILMLILTIIDLSIWVMLTIKALQGELFKLPIAGNFVDIILTK